MKISGRNQLPGEIVEIKKGDVVSEVVIQVGEHQIAGVITTTSVENMALAVGDRITALIKATEVSFIK
ncbi:MAG: TOBE domain-containing protein [Deltaproteobacteria bacterium]|nr:TOBE domain-containing protein [Thermodesulfobacteriota bacterium]